MDRVGGVVACIGTHRFLGITVVVLMATLVLSVPSGKTQASHICSIQKNSIKIPPYNTVFIGTNSYETNVHIEAAGCVNDTQVLSLLDFAVSNITSRSVKNLNWYEFTYINCGNYVVKFGSKFVRFRHKTLHTKCNTKPITLKVESGVRLGRKCGGSRDSKEQSKDACRELLKGVSETDHNFSAIHALDYKNLFDLLKKQNRVSTTLDDQHYPFEHSEENTGKNQDWTLDWSSDSQPEPKETLVNSNDTFLLNPDFLQPVTMPGLPTYSMGEDTYLNSDTSFRKRRHYKENGIPILIGLIAFTVSMCLRFCLCRGKRVVQRVTTVTVIRSRPTGDSEESQDQPDPPPSYIDVINDTRSHQNPTGEGAGEPPPPSYADIVNEVQPPTYSELEGQPMSSSEEVPLAEQQTEGHTTVDPQPDPDAKGLPNARSVLTKYRSQQKQFAFKVLQEDD